MRVNYRSVIILTLRAGNMGMDFKKKEKKRKNIFYETVAGVGEVICSRFSFAFVIVILALFSSSENASKCGLHYSRYKYGCLKRFAKQVSGCFQQWGTALIQLFV